MSTLRIQLVISTWLVAALVFQPAIGQGLQTRPVPRALSLADRLNARGDITLRDMSLRDALFTISQTWSVNIVSGNDIAGTVNGVFHNTPLREVLDAILLVNGYGYRATGDSLVVMRFEDLGVAGPSFESVTISMPSGSLEEVMAGAQLLLSPQGKMQAIPSVRSLLVIDFPDQVRQIRQFIETVGAVRPPEPGLLQGTAGDGTVQAAHFSLQFVGAVELQVAVQSALGDETRVSAMEAENRLIVVGDTGRLRLAHELIRQLDVPRPQVRITAFIYDIALEDLEAMGVDWNHSIKGRNLDAEGNAQDAWQLSSQFTEPAAVLVDTAANGAASAAASATPLTQPIGSLMTFRTMTTHFDLDSVIAALHELKGARLVADPTVTVQHLEEANIRIVTRIPIQQLTQTQQGGQIGTTTFEDAGITLTVRPQIADDGTIVMRVTPTFSVLAGFQRGQPIIDTREATTVVRVADRQTLVIGGLRQKSEVGTIRGIPWLMNVRHIGQLFRYHEMTTRESELVVFIRPELVTPTSPGTPREEVALHHAETSIERLPYAFDAPVMPKYRDYHRFIQERPWDMGRGMIEPSPGIPEPLPPIVAPARSASPSLHPSMRQYIDSGPGSHRATRDARQATGGRGGR